MKLVAVLVLVLGCSTPPSATPHPTAAAGSNANTVPGDCEARRCPRGTYCIVQQAGAQGFELAHGSPGFSVNCEPVPSQCTATPTCACLDTVGGFGNCFEAAWGLEIRTPPPP